MKNRLLFSALMISLSACGRSATDKGQTNAPVSELPSQEQPVAEPKPENPFRRVLIEMEGEFSPTTEVESEDYRGKRFVKFTSRVSPLRFSVETDIQEIFLDRPQAAGFAEKDQGALSDARQNFGHLHIES